MAQGTSQWTKRVDAQFGRSARALEELASWRGGPAGRRLGREEASCVSRYLVGRGVIEVVLQVSN